VAIPIRIPAMSSDIESGTIQQWRKSIGDPIEAGEVLFDMETDKAVFEVESPAAGILGKILFPDGSSDIPVDTVVAVLLEHGESADDIPDFETIDSSSEPEPGGSPAAIVVGVDGDAASPAQTAADGSRIFASPLARRLATRLNVDIRGISGRGPNGRILKADVEEAACREKAPPSGEVSVPTDGGGPAWTDIANTKMRKVIARRLGEAWRDIPHFYLTVDCELDALLDVRTQLNVERAADGVEGKISINDFIIKAAALALADVPAANTSWADETIRQYNTVDISVAVATPNGLITPVLRQVDRKPLAAISEEIKELADRAREGKLLPDEYKGGGFTVSNLGMYGIRQFGAIINPPQSCILAVGVGEERAVVRGTRLAIATVASFTLSVDHRSVDGVVGAEFLQAFKRHVERPLALLLGQN
jgi:pyruvate dehydrogenase E2 component (dihydrolipoamide acetyltransferase)